MWFLADQWSGAIDAIAVAQWHAYENIYTYGSSGVYLEAIISYGVAVVFREDSNCISLVVNDNRCYGGGMEFIVEIQGKAEMFRVR